MRLYRQLYLEAWHKIRGATSNQAKVLIGELSPYLTAGKVSGPAKRRQTVTALGFLSRVSHGFDEEANQGERIGSGPASTELLQTHGVAWHPYQHRRNPRRVEKKKSFGIGQADKIQDRIQDLYKARDSDNHRLLKTPKGKRPSLLFTEFGYYNLPTAKLFKTYDSARKAKKGNSYWHGEPLKASLLNAALDRAKKVRARWMLLYQATEQSPGEFRRFRTDLNPPVDQDYGLTGLAGSVTGIRTYGKDLHARTGADYAKFNVPQERRAYCSVYRWAKRNRLAGSDPGCP